MSEKPFRIGVLASGGGTNLQAILDRFGGGEMVEVAAVGSDKADARALERAAEAGVPAATFPREEHPTREDRDAAIAEWLASHGVELVVLAGYMQLLSPGFLERFPNGVINVHPALLPSFPGLDAIGQAFRHGVRVSGVTVHFVDAGMDTGPIILQEAIELAYTRDIEEFEEQIHAVEHRLLPRAIELIAVGAVRIDARNPRLVRIESE